MPIRVLIVDDSLIVRKLIEGALSTEPDIAVVGTASNGAVGLTKAAELQPDIVTLDVEMPQLDGIETLRRLRQQQPRAQVIMFSSLTERGAAATITALSAGAADYVAKPTNAGGLDATRERIRAELVPRVKALGARPAAQNAVKLAAKPVTRPRLVAIASSTGGPAALQAVLSRLPPTFAAPIVIAQHMQATFTTLLARQLTSVCALPVAEAPAVTPLFAGRILLAPGDQHLVVENRDGSYIAKTHREAAVNSCRPSADVLFASIAKQVGADVLAVVLTGMGQDGLVGAQQIRAAGGDVVVQDAATSVVWGMPGAVARAGIASHTLALTDIAGYLIDRVGTGEAARR